MEQTITTAASPDRVWSIWADLTSWPTWTETVTRLDPVEPGREPGVGASYRVTQPRLGTAVYRITDWQPGRTFTWVSPRPGVTTTATHTVGPAAGGGAEAVATLTWTGFLGPVIRLLYGRLGARYAATELAALAGLSERG